MKITELADLLSLDLQVIRYNNQNGRWSAHFERAETKESKHDPILSSSYGNGKSPQEAVGEYACKISGKLLVINAGSKDRREFQVPVLEL